jgi:hypothetical protein
MKNKLRNGISLSLLPQIIIVQWLAGHADWVENYYSKGIYPHISAFFRTLFGWIPFSVGEIIYTLLILLGLRYVYRNWTKIKNNRRIFLRDCIMVLAVIYFTFQMVWGLNYHRKPLSETLLINEEATYEDIETLTQNLIDKTNALQFQITNDSSEMVKIPYTRDEIFEKTIANYDVLDEQLPFLTYQKRSIKKSMYSIMSSYMGIGGYLNPFTNEAQVNRKTPLFRFPVVSAHEIGHQIGYAAENETNFIGYLVTLKNKDVYFQYAANAYALSYCLNALHLTDQEGAKELYAKLNAGVIKNYEELKAFQEAYENPVKPIFTWVFNTFLKANNQDDGVKSYSRVVHLLVGYHERFPIE